MKTTMIQCIRIIFGSLVVACLAISTPALAAKGGKGGGGGGGGKTYSVGGTVEGLAGGDSVTLQNVWTDGTETSTQALELNANGAFAFPKELTDGASYSVSVATVTSGLSCTVANGDGSISRKNVNNVVVTCQSTNTATYSVGGTVSGLAAGNTVTLQNNGGDDLTTGDGGFVFSEELADGSGYNVTVLVQPAGQECSVSSSSGNVGGADVTSVSVTCTDVAVAVTRIEGAGDSIMRGYNASCGGNTGLFDFLCYGGGDQNQNSFLDGSSSNVLSLLDRYRTLSANFGGDKDASESGSEMTDPGKNNFQAQAAAIVASTTQPSVVVVELGGNDLCNRSSDQDLYSDTQWQDAIDAGLDVLVNQLPDGSTVYLSSVPRVQDLRSVGIALQTGNSRVNCENFWSSFDVCRIATASDTYFSALEERQRTYNAILAQRAAHYNAEAGTTGVEVIAEYQGEGAPSVGTYQFAPEDINGGDCFHPSIHGQNQLSETLWQNSPR